MTTAAHVKELARLLDLDHPPVAVTFHEHEPTYEPLDEAEDADVVLVRLTARA